GGVVMGAVTHVAHARLGPLPQVRLPWRFAEAKAEPRCAPPLLGQDTVTILLEQGYGSAQIAEWIAQGVVAGDAAGLRQHPAG
ncbi:MAG: hypothetical protein K6T74_11245, partial [Geminicoccaceae bacterium]|nr:hypothetical protein [Geminicoccaceae bacterium]